MLRREENALDAGRHATLAQLAERPADRKDGMLVAVAARNVGVARSGHERAGQKLANRIDAVPVRHPGGVPAVRIQERAASRGDAGLDGRQLAVEGHVVVDQDHVRGGGIGDDLVARSDERGGDPVRLALVVEHSDAQRVEVRARVGNAWQMQHGRHPSLSRRDAGSL